MQAPVGSGPETGVRYARYLRGKDYHLEIAEKLERVMQNVAKNHPSLQWKVCVDTSAVLERAWAAAAGLGWIGKNTMLIHPQYGSYLLLGEVLINQRVENSSSPLKDYCGNCARCLNACPTRAFTQPRVLDATRCISYWTLEKRGELALSVQDQSAVSNWVAGCDICQEVCPFNTKSERLWENAPPTPAGAVSLSDWESLERESIEDTESA